MKVHRWMRSKEGRQANLDIDDAAEGDRRWFEANPGERICYRGACAGEAAQGRAIHGLPGDVNVLITVEQVQPGFRLRYLSGIHGDLNIDPRVRLGHTEVSNISPDITSQTVMAAARLLAQRSGAVNVLNDLVH